jgi:myo-inositol 2-dehydrogenase/D-chiro-inositol 1-dehydrogenase
MRVLLCGAGQIGAVHATSLAESRRVSELVITDLDMERAQALAARVGARALALDEAFALDPGAVVIGAPTPAHAELVRRSIDRGIPCLCEKPLSGELEESVDLVREVRVSANPRARCSRSSTVANPSDFRPLLKPLSDLRFSQNGCK